MSPVPWITNSFLIVIEDFFFISTRKINICWSYRYTHQDTISEERLAFSTELIWIILDFFSTFGRFFLRWFFVGFGFLLRIIRFLLWIIRFLLRCCRRWFGFLSFFRWRTLVAILIFFVSWIYRSITIIFQCIVFFFITLKIFVFFFIITFFLEFKDVDQKTLFLKFN